MPFMHPVNVTFQTTNNFSSKMNQTSREGLGRLNSNAVHETFDHNWYDKESEIKDSKTLEHKHHKVGSLDFMHIRSPALRYQEQKSYRREQAHQFQTEQKLMQQMDDMFANIDKFPKLKGKLRA